MGYIRMDLAQMAQFFRSAEDICNSFRDSQSAIDRAFNLAIEAWRDNNAATAYVQLDETARGISRLYDSLVEAIDYVARVCNNRAELVDFERFAPPTLIPFTTDLTEVTVDNSIINTDPDALEEFKSALDGYVQSIADNSERLGILYDRIGASWDDEQYVKFGDALSEFTNRMQAQVDILDRISAFLSAKIEIMRRSDI